MARIEKVTKAEIIKYSDSGQRTAYVYWVDSKGEKGRTEGSPGNLHMKALVARARREKVKVERKTW
jgi:hypothetical protein